MIARMSKYNFVLFAAQSEDFVEKLRGLGLVDITTAGWEPSEEDRQLLLDIESLAKAAEFLKNFRAGERCDAAAAPFASGEEAYAHYAAAHREAATLNAEIGRLEKAAEELRPWGAFDVEATRKLAAGALSCAISSPSATPSTSSWPSGRSAIRFRRSAAPMPWCGSSSWPSPARRLRSTRRR